MKFVRHIEEIPFDKNSVISVGTFDGVHLAHQEVIKRVIEEAHLHKYRSVIVTFEPHPREIIYAVEQKRLKLITTLDEKKLLFENFGIDWLLVLEFNNELSNMSYRDFYTKYLIKGIGFNTIVEGFNHHWGKDRKGNIDELYQMSKEFNFKFIKVEPFKLDGIEISSSLIRNALYKGDVEKVKIYLGRPYSIEGKVVEGDHRGSKLGFPTANLELIDDRKIIPMNGIYFGIIKIKNKKYFCLIIIGTRPTFYSDGQQMIEVHILDFNQDIYNSMVKIEILKRLRDEIKFSTVEELVNQMHIDVEYGLKLQNEYKNLLFNN